MRFNHYNNVSLLAETSTGYVYRAKKQGSEQFIALRVADLPFTTEQAIENLAEECRLYFQLQHHKIVQFAEPSINYETKHIEVEMEYMPGGTLERYLSAKRGTQIPEVEIWQIIGDISEGLSHLHSRTNGRTPTAHGHLQPKSIFLKRNTCKLSFFTISRFIARSQRKKTAVDLGLYNAPEILRWQACGPAADIWSFGLIILDLATTLTRENETVPHDLSSITLSGYSETLTWLAHACLLVNPNERVTAAEIFAMAPTQQAARAAIYNTSLTNKLPVDYLSESLTYIEFFRTPYQAASAIPRKQTKPCHPLNVVETPQIDLGSGSVTQDTDFLMNTNYGRDSTHGDEHSHKHEHGQAAKLPSTPGCSSTESDDGEHEYGNINTVMFSMRSPDAVLHGNKDAIETKIKLLSISPYEAITTSLATDNPKLLFALFSHIHKYHMRIDFTDVFRYQSQHIVEVSEKTPLMWAAHLGAAETVAKSFSLVRHVYRGETALMLAAAAGHLECVKLLLSELFIQKHTSANVLTHVGGWTALMKAAQHGHTITAELLLAEAGVRKADGMTALMLAAQADQPDCVHLLLEREAGMQDQDGWTALMYAANSGSIASVNLLLGHEQGMISDNGQTALAAAIRAGHKHCIHTLFPREGCLMDDAGNLIYESVLAEMKGVEADEAKRYMELVMDAPISG